jgi:hypothetical protein
MCGGRIHDHFVGLLFWLKTLVANFMNVYLFFHIDDIEQEQVDDILF